VGPLDYYTRTPCRILDTRNTVGPLGGPALAAGSSRTFAVWNVCEIPTTARAVTINVTATGATGAGHLRFHPADQLVPGTSALNFSLGMTRANNAVLGLGSAGDFKIYCGMASGWTHVVVDVTGPVAASPGRGGASMPDGGGSSASASRAPADASHRGSGP
jgi:hypothetical protein